MALGALIVFAGQPLYSVYANAPRVWGFSALFDQQLGGLIMWLIMDIPLIVTITILFFRWMASQERKQRESEAEQYGDDDIIWQPTPQASVEATEQATAQPPAVGSPASGAE